MTNKKEHSQPKTFGPYSPLRRAGSLYFTSGQVGFNANTNTVDKNITQQTISALDNLAQTLQTQGLTLNDVVKTTVYLTNINDFEAMNKVYVDYFEPPRPARSTVAVQSLPKVSAKVPLLVEIEAVATKGVDHD